MSGGSALGRLVSSLSRTVLAGAAFGLLAAGATASAQTDFAGRVLRVCADPENMPFSNEKGEGFENKLVDLIAAKLDMQLVYTWLPQVMGHVATKTPIPTTGPPMCCSTGRTMRASQASKALPMSASRARHSAFSPARRR